MGEVVQVGDLSLPDVILLAGPAVERLDLLGPRLVLGVILLVDLVEVVNPSLVILLGPLLKRLDLILPALILCLYIYRYRSNTQCSPNLRSFSLVAEFSNEL